MELGEMKKSARFFSLFVTMALAALMGACGGPPTEAMDAAEDALLNAAWAEDCAQETFRSAKKMLDEAKQASADGDYDEAKRKAEAASRLAEQARKDAELDREECERRKSAMNQIDDRLGDKDGSPGVDRTDVFSLATISFPFNEFALSDSSQTDLSHNAAWLLDNQALRIRIEGHTDDRGSTEYNLTLSQKRAQVVKRYLQTLGVDASRMTIIPYGEEKPASFGAGEGDHAKNRRAEFVTF